MNSSSVPFDIINYGTVLVNNVSIGNYIVKFIEAGTIVSTAGASYGNPNIPANRYSYLV